MSSGNKKYVFTQALAPSGEGEVEGSLWYNTTLNRLETYTGSAWTAVAPSFAISRLVLIPRSYDSVIQGTWSFATNAAFYTNVTCANTSAAQNDGLRYSAYIEPGTYTIRIIGMRQTDKGIVHIKVDTTEVETIDLYGALDYVHMFEATGVSITATGHVNIDLEMKSKNGSSSGYAMDFHMVEFIRTS